MIYFLNPFVVQTGILNPKYIVIYDTDSCVIGSSSSLLNYIHMMLNTKLQIL